MAILQDLYCAVNAKTVSDDKALRINPTNLKSTAVVSGLVGRI